MATGSTGTGSAVVIGAGIAGLSAARTLARRFDQVLVVDRDELPEDPVPRRGVPQGSHAHVLLAAGLRALEELFPGLRAQLVTAGATPFDPGNDLCFVRYGAVAPAVTTGLDLVSLSRPLLETTLRRRVAALPNVSIRTRTAVSALDGDATRVSGAVLDDGTRVAADLVVDCSGRGTRSDRWLADLGLPVPRVREVRVGVGYASRLLRREPGDLAGFSAALVLPAPPGQKRLGVAIPIEGDRWLVGLAGWHGAHPGTDDESFRAHARSLPHPAIAQLLDRAQPLTGITTVGFPASRRRMFETLRQVPAGYLAAGDAICSFNPVYGQGMTCAALEALALGAALDRHGAPTAGMVRDFYRAAAAAMATPWSFAVGADFAYPETVGARPLGTTAFNWYSQRIGIAVQHSVDVRRAFSNVQQLVAPPSVFFRPAMVAKVLRASRT
jgi:2-polyprenyl-6-methoxyphenol hydroxylase-like FAD-dependent oxidoreductase